MPLFQKRIMAAVGRLGVNLPNDLRTVKALLNEVPEPQGGPIGIILESTPLSEVIGHIERFQGRQFGRADGRVDPEGRTLQSLRAFDPHPDEPPSLPTTSSGKKRTGKVARR